MDQIWDKFDDEVLKVMLGSKFKNSVWMLQFEFPGGVDDIRNKNQMM